MNLEIWYHKTPAVNVVDIENQVRSESKPSEKFSEKFSKSLKEKNKESKFSSCDASSFEEKCLTSFNLSLRSKDFEQFQNFEFLNTEEGKKYKKILIHHNDYGRSFGFGLGHEPFEAACCKEKRCFITDDKSIFNTEEFDAILMHFRNLDKKNLPQNRRRHQRWILYESEPPFYSSRETQNFEGIFNWTMTYRRDSDIVVGYGHVCKKEDIAIKDFSTLENLPLDSAMKTKTKMVAWMVSNCETPSKREEYVKELQKFLPVDIYGSCGQLECTKDPIKSKGCYFKIEKEYKFYLSFENNLCKDYATEKFFNILRFYVIPVVRGYADYASIAPPHSYINVEDFKSKEDLANYLIYLDKNDTAYKEYFNWKKDYFAFNMLPWLNHAKGFCELCKRLHSDETEKIYYNLTGWFLGEAHCNEKLGL